MSEKRHKVIVLLGTARRGRESEKVARFVFGELSKRTDVSLTFVDVREFLFRKTIPPWEEPENPTTRPWRELVRGTDAFVMVTPEYNHGYPGELKTLLDAAYDEYEGKPAALVAVSSGRIGGARVVEQLKPVLIELGLVVVRTAMYVPRVASFFDTEGRPTDTSFTERLAGFFDELIKMSEKMRL